MDIWRIFGHTAWILTNHYTDPWWAINGQLSHYIGKAGFIKLTYPVVQNSEIVRSGSCCAVVQLATASPKELQKTDEAQQYYLTNQSEQVYLETNAPMTYITLIEDVILRT